MQLFSADATIIVLPKKVLKNLKSSSYLIRLAGFQSSKVLLFATETVL